MCFCPWGGLRKLQVVNGPRFCRVRAHLTPTESGRANASAVTSDLIQTTVESDFRLL